MNDLIMIVEDDAKFTAIRRIDGTRAIQNSHLMLVSQARTAAHLDFEPWRNRKVQTSTNRGALARRDKDGLIDVGLHIHARIEHMLVGRQRKLALVEHAHATRQTAEEQEV